MLFRSGGTLARHLAIQAAVRLLVPAEIGGGRVRLAALIAGVTGPPSAGLPLLILGAGRRAAFRSCPAALTVSLPPGAPVGGEDGEDGGIGAGIGVEGWRDWGGIGVEG